MTLRRVISWGLAVLVLAAGGYWVFKPRPVAVETAPVIQGRFVATIEEDGRTRVRDRFAVSSPLAGRLSRISLRPGDAVKGGDTIAILQPSLPPLRDPRTRLELEERVGAAEAAFEEANVTQERLRLALEKARSDYERSKQLNQRRVISAAQFERDAFAFEAAQRELAAAGQRREAAGHALAEARAALGKTNDIKEGAGDRFSITAPVSGSILRVQQESETMVNAGTPLIEIGDPADIEVIVDVLTSDAVRIQQGALVTLDRWGGPKPLQGRVRRIEPSGFTKVSALGVEEQRVWIVIDIVSPREAWRNLADGFRLEAAIVVEDIADALIVPAGALFRREDKWFAFMVQDGRAQARVVEVLQRSGKSAAIKSGLKAGDRVIVFPPSSLKANDAVTELAR